MRKLLLASCAVVALGTLGTLGTLGASGGQRLVIEEFLRGEEVTFIALCDGKHAVPLAPTQDHKRAGDNMLLTINRGGKTQKINVKLGAAPESL